MRFFCDICGKSWATRSSPYTMWEPVRKCPECLRDTEQMQWLNVDAGIKGPIEEGD